MFDANRYAWNIVAEKSAGKAFDLTKSDYDAQIRPFIQKEARTNLEISNCNDECFDSAYRDYIKSIKTTKALSAAQKKKTGTGFSYPKQLGFRSKKIGKGSIELRSRGIKYNYRNKTISFHPKYFKGCEKIKMKTNLAKLARRYGKLLQYSCRLTQDYDRFYLLAPYDKPVKLKKRQSSVCAIDPGVRTFLTGYDPEGSGFEICSGTGHLDQKQTRIFALQKRLAETSDRIKKQRIANIIHNIYRKIKNCVNDMHHYVAKQLAQSYTSILLPQFESSKMARKDNRRINATTTRRMLTLSPYSFRMILGQKMEETGGKLIVCTEEYTTKTCGCCGRLNHGIGSSKQFVCPFDDCGVKLDRDLNAARNIYRMNCHSVDTI